MRKLMILCIFVYSLYNISYAVNPIPSMTDGSRCTRTVLRLHAKYCWESIPKGKIYKAIIYNYGNHMAKLDSMRSVYHSVKVPSHASVPINFCPDNGRITIKSNLDIAYTLDIGVKELNVVDYSEKIHCDL